MRLNRIRLPFAMLLTLSLSGTAALAQFSNYTRLSPDTKAGLGASVAVLSGTAYLAMKGDGNNNFYISTTTDGVDVTSTSRSDGEFGLLNYAPSIAVYNGELYVVFVDGYSDVYLTTSRGGGASSFSTPTRIYEPGSFGNSLYPDGPPTLVAFGGNLYAFFELVNETSGDQIQSIYFNGTEWQGSGTCAYTPSSLATGATDHAAVGAAVFNSTLYVGTQIGSSSTANTLTVCSSASPSSSGTFTNYSSINPEGGISATVFLGDLYFGFKSNSSQNYLELAQSSDGTNFTWTIFDGVETSYKIQINGTSGYEIAPALTVFNSDLYVFYTANDNTHYLYQINEY
jgi:hypothetical protein